MPTELHKAVVSLIHRGVSDLHIAWELAAQFDILGGDNERQLLANINRIRRELEAFRLEAPAIAEVAFREGCTWKEVFDGLASRGLLSSCEITTIAVHARDKVEAEQS